MGTGYTRNDTANNIADGNIINASDLDGEFDAVQSAFNASTGHTHDGTAGEGAPIETIGPSQDVVATASVLRPKTDNTVDLGTTSLEYKDLFLDGTAHIDTLDVDENASITGTLGVTGATTLSSTLGVTGATTLSSTLGVTGAATLSSTLGVTGAATLSSTLAVTGATGIDGDFDINTNKFTVASATGNTAVAGTLGVTGATTATGGLNVDTISEITSANGVVIDGVTLKDGGATVTADVTFGDNDKAIFGAGSDLQIYHDGSSSRIVDAGTGSLKIQAENFAVNNVGDTENMITAVPDGAVQLFYDNSSKLATTNTGIAVTGNATFADNGKAIFGAGSDLQIYHDGSNSYIKDAGTGNLNLQGENLALENTSGDNYLVGVNGSFVKLYHSGSEKLATTSTGIQVTGNIANTSGNLTLDVAGNIILDADGGFISVKDAGIEIGNLGNYSSDFVITASVQDKDIIFKGNDNGSIVDALTLDMSEAGRATFNDVVRIPTNLEHAGDADTFFGFPGANNFIITAGNVSRVYGSASETVINEDSADLDFRVESDSNANALFIDAGNNSIGTGTGAPATYVNSGGIAMKGNAQSEFANVGTNIATSGIMHQERYYNHSGSNVYEVARTRVNIGAGQVNRGEYQFAVSNGAALRQWLDVDYSGNVTFNEGSYDSDFRVESDGNANMLFVDAGTNRVSVGQGTPSTSAAGSSTIGDFTVSTTVYPVAVFERDFGSATTGDYTGQAIVGKTTGTPSSTLSIGQRFAINNDLLGEITSSVGGQMAFKTASAGSTFTERLVLGTSESVFNEGSNNIDFRVESDNNANMLYVDAGNDRIGINQSSPQAILDIEGTTVTYGGMAKIYLTDVSGNASSRNWAIGNGGSGYGNFTIGVSNVATGDPMADGTHKTPFIIQPSGSVVINEDSNDADFRIESDGNANMLFVDAGNDAICINTNSITTSPLNIQSDSNARAIRIVGRSDDYGEVDFFENDNSTQLVRLQAHNTVFNIRAYDIPMVFQMTTVDCLRINTSGIVVNEGSANRDFRVESNAQTHMLFVDGGNDTVHIGDSTGTSVVNVNSTGRGSLIALNVVKTDSGNGTNTFFNLTNNADQDIQFKLSEVGATTKSVYVGPSTNTQMNLTGASVSSLNRDLYLDSSSLVVNQDSRDYDFRVESNSLSHALFVDASNNSIGMGASNASNYGARMMSSIDGGSSYATFASVNTATSGTRRQIDFFDGSSTTRKGSIETDGSNTSFNTSSDYRLKENVTYSWDATTRLKELKPARFDWIGNSEAGTQDGFLAHEVSSVVPLAVSGEKDAVDDDGNPVMQGIDQSKLVPLLVKTIQELEARITALENA